MGGFQATVIVWSPCACMRMSSTRPGAVSAYADLETLLHSPWPILFTAATLKV